MRLLAMVLVCAVLGAAYAAASGAVQVLQVWMASNGIGG